MDLKKTRALVVNCENKLAAVIALSLAANGAEVITHYRSISGQVTELMRELETIGRNTSTIVSTLFDEAEIAKVFKELDEHSKYPDLIINIMDTPAASHLDDTGFSKWHKATTSNLLSCFLLTRLSVRGKLTETRATPALVLHVMNTEFLRIDTERIRVGFSETGLFAFIRRAAVEYAPSVRVNGIVLGELDITKLDEQSEGKKDKISPLNPLKLVGNTSQLAEFILSLATNDFITGAIIPVDGGLHLVGSVESKLNS
ncbi:MAG: SDR family oxidoreductase [Chloroflexi bacterium]|nr:SDR family oxidoreductase [Chloroflexota bacterium]